jgi:23S rRNA (cytosine1962-C5)-methyltransferase
MRLSTLYLKSREERRLLSGHLWIYSNEIDNKKSPLAKFKSGELVVVRASNNYNLGIAYINPHNLLCARLLTTTESSIDKVFFERRFKQALILREHCFNQPYYRAIFGESDYLPGLIVDRFGNDLVVQITTSGMENLKPIIIDVLLSVFNPKSILLRNDTFGRELESLSLDIEAVFGKSPEEILIEEHGTKFYIPLWAGQKTGWFYDQQLNRSRLKLYVKNQSVLDVFSYLGAWGIQAANFGAQNVCCIDSSELAINYIKRNAMLNNLADRIDTIHDDAFNALKNLLTQKQKFGVIILDPPAFIKKNKDLVNGINAYLRLHEMALCLLKPNGMLFTCSCSMHLSKDALLNIVRKAGLSTNTLLKVIEQLHQAQDHPIHPAIAETEYLKGFIINKF